MRWVRVGLMVGVSLVLSLLIAFDLVPGDQDDQLPFAVGPAGTRLEQTDTGSRNTADPSGPENTATESPPPREVVLSSEAPSARPSSTGSHVTPDDIGGSVGAAEPLDVIDGDVAMVTDHELLTDVTINGCVTIDADHVTLRNVVVSCDHTYPIKVTATTGTWLEGITVDCRNDSRTRKGVYFEHARDFRVDRIHITRCDDQFFIDGGLGSSSITNSVFHNQAPAGEAHTDGMQIGTFETTTGTLTVTGNWWEYNRSGCCANGVLFLSGQSRLTVEMRNNFLDHDFGVHVLRCQPAANCLIDNNTINGTPSGLFAYAASNGGTARCNRFTDGTLVPPNLHQGFTVDNSTC